MTIYPRGQARVATKEKKKTKKHSYGYGYGYGYGNKSNRRYGFDYVRTRLQKKAVDDSYKYVDDDDEA